MGSPQWVAKEEEVATDDVVPNFEDGISRAILITAPKLYFFFISLS